MKQFIQIVLGKMLLISIKVDPSFDKTVGRSIRADENQIPLIRSYS